MESSQVPREAAPEARSREIQGDTGGGIGRYGEICVPKEAAPEANPAAKEASIPRRREESKAASEGCGMGVVISGAERCGRRPAVTLRGSLAASGVLAVLAVLAVPPTR